MPPVARTNGKPVGVRFSDEVLAKIAVIAECEDRSVAAVIRRLTTQALKTREEFKQLPANG